MPMPPITLSEEGWQKQGDKWGPDISERRFVGEMWYAIILKTNTLCHKRTHQFEHPTKYQRSPPIFLHRRPTISSYTPSITKKYIAFSMNCVRSTMRKIKMAYNVELEVFHKGEDHQKKQYLYICVYVYMHTHIQICTPIYVYIISIYRSMFICVCLCI